MSSRLIRLALLLFSLGFMIPAAQAAPGRTRIQTDVVSVGARTYKLADTTTFQRGCFPPCLCPVMETAGVRGTFKLTYAGAEGSFRVYQVDDVNWTVALWNSDLRITGSGRYKVGRTNASPAVFHQMELDLVVGDNPVEHFDSGLVPQDSSSGINIAVAINGFFCWDTAVDIHAKAVGHLDILPYGLTTGSTYQKGCFDPCACPLGPELPTYGTFALVKLMQTAGFTEYAVINVNWYIPPTNAGGGMDGAKIKGSGTYRLYPGNATDGQQLSLDLRVNGDPPAHFESGFVPVPAGFPLIDALVSINGLFCLDTAIQVVAGRTNTTP